MGNLLMFLKNINLTTCFYKGSLTQLCILPQFVQCLSPSSIGCPAFELWLTEVALLSSCDLSTQIWSRDYGSVLIQYMVEVALKR